ncbi:Uncharacterised protein [Klebsiella pneumoniae]|uniref:DNA, erythromycin resistance determinant genes n=5 Tax=Enterobacteriaceae TaxID=543 RepID=Q47392_ECOLX|nr:hypothetical protein AI2998V1_5014 [Klebsiella pneumoniae]CAF2864765.1 hypothetical protein AI2937V1_5517 [Klebsiella oxytoca]BAA03772.1 unnamed protein product [Escherichia coli]CAH6396664.1 hypothetical protein AI2998V1_5014 [Klebsiella pneumoniae]CAH6714874.1 hypothetical protein AI2937V1_5517 [Klebsiella oxytoca]
MTLPLAPTMPTKIITIPKRGRSRGSLQRKATPARMERVAVVVIVRAARAGSTHAPSRPARTEQNAVSPSVGAAPSRPIAAPPRAGPPRIATFPITAFSDETRSTESPATWPSLGSSLSCAAIPGASNAAPSTTQAISPVFERAPTASSSGMLAMATPPTTPEINATGARPNRSTRPPPTHAPMMVAMTLLAAVAPAQAALFV